MGNKIMFVAEDEVVMPKKFFAENKLSLSAKGLLATMFSLDEPVGPEGFVEMFAEMFGEKEETIESCLMEFLETGYLEDMKFEVEDVKNE